MARGGRSGCGKKGSRSKLGAGRGTGGRKANDSELGDQACAGPTHVELMDSTAATHSGDMPCTDSQAKAIVNVTCGLASKPIFTKSKAQELSMYEKMTKHIVVPRGKRKQRSLEGGNCAPDRLNRAAGASRVCTRTMPIEESALALEVPSTPLAAGNKAAIAVGVNDQKTGIKLSIKLSQKNRQSLEPTSGESKMRRTMDLQSSNKRIQELEDELNKLKLDHAADMAAMETRVRGSHEEVQRLTSAAADMASENLKLKAKCQEIVQTLASGSYAHDGANPTMLEAACKRVYHAMIHLGKVLVEFEPAVKGCSVCCEKTCDRAFQAAKHASTHLQIDLTRPVQARHNWGHWICSKLFLGFESASFDVHDEHEVVAPFNLRTHAAERFKGFVDLQEKAADDMFSEDRKFHLFCVRKYREVLPADLVMVALHPGINREISRADDGRFIGDEQIHRQFLEVARAAWLLHHLAFSFDPPASIFRMERVTLFDERYHNPVVSDGEPCQALQLEDHAAPVAFIITPALRVGKIIIKSQVFLIEQR